MANIGHISVTQISIKRKRQSAAFSHYMETAFIKDIKVYFAYGLMVEVRQILKKTPQSYLLIAWCDDNAESPIRFLKTDTLTQFEAQITELGPYEEVEKPEYILNPDKSGTEGGS
jgi:hypothetical protein